MKILIFLSLGLAVAAFFFFRQNNQKTCCSTEQFANFGSQQTFQDAHPSPTKTDSIHRGEMVSWPIANAANGGGYLVKNEVPTNKYLLLFHEWWGLNDNTKREADLWANELKINVLAVDLYDGKAATTADEAGKLMQSNDKTRSAALISGAMKFAGDAADFRTMGWCFGGGWSLQAAILGGPKTRACVIYYGMPEEDVAKLGQLSTDVCGIFATKDKWINREVVSKFEKNMAAAGKTVANHWYEADHAFANPSGPRYQKREAVEARAVVKSYLMNR